jgi:uncharacterized protein (TIGR03083 family)
MATAHSAAADSSMSAGAAILPPVAEPLPFARCVDQIESSAAGLVSRAGTAGLDAAVVTCPEWSVGDLVAHQGMVHRWAAAQLRLDETPVPSHPEFLVSVPPDQLLNWLADGVVELTETLRTVDPDVPACVFLKDAPRPAHFWARRQAHETTIHSVDALSGVLGRQPSAAEVDVELELALDGIDELLTGFFPRGRSTLAELAPLTLAVTPSDSQRAWTVRVDGERLTTIREHRPDADATFAGTAAQLYLGLWNRGAEITASGRPGVLQAWQKAQRIRWS